MKRLARTSAEFEDIAALPHVERDVLSADEYPPLKQALPALRKNPFEAMRKYERKSLWFMFFVHVSDVHLSIAGALVSVQILRLFEKSPALEAFLLRFGIDPSQKIALGATMALFIFAANFLAAALHAQKIERETLVRYRIQSRFTEYMFQFVMRMSRASRIKFSTGDIVNLAQNDARHISELYAHCFVDMPVLVVSVLVVVMLMFWMLGNAAWVGLGLVLLQIPISGLFSWFASRMHGELMLRSDRRISLVTEWIQGMRLVRYFGWSKHFQKEIDAKALSEFRQELKLRGLYSVTFALSVSWSMVVCLGIFAAILFLGGEKSSSQIFGALWLSAILGQQLTPLPWFVSLLVQSRVGSKRLANLFQSKIQDEEFSSTPQEIASQRASLEASQQESLEASQQESLEEILKSKLEGHSVGFELEHVSVRFSENDPWILKNVNQTFAPGSFTAIVGPVGSGKSVLMQLLMGDVVPTEGKVFLVIKGKGPQSLRIPLHSEMGLRILRSAQTFVPQEPFIASATIRENVPLRYFDDSIGRNIPVADDKSVMNALYAASFGEDIQSFPAGLSTELGERGVNLSGGQKQRLSLARAAFATAKIVILDDPLSAVDKKTEIELANALLEARWKGSATVLWATHRLDFLSLADEVLFLEQAEIKERGPADELLNRPGSRLAEFVETVKRNEGGEHRE
jgi:ABC-type multidrug transport system fused ATPase/permease subunit